jgi:hypothetical protein
VDNDPIVLVHAMALVTSQDAPQALTGTGVSGAGRRSRRP